MAKTFRQYDARWGKKSYPPGSGDTMAGAGCGPTSCASLIVNNPTYKKLTPAKTRSFMVKNGYAIAGQGTAWAGIDACMQNFGFRVERFYEMDSFWDEMEKDGRVAIILFRGGTRGGVTWTTSGHFVAASSYKEKNGKHYLYTRDPGSRKNDGWHCYETEMKGLIVLLWVCYLPPSKYSGTFPKLPKKGYFEKGDTGANVKRLQLFLNWAVDEDLPGSKKFGSKTAKAVAKFRKKYGIEPGERFGKKCLAKAKSIKK